ncbi:MULTISPECIES: hypothetical protein [Citrobacter]
MVYSAALTFAIALFH